MPARVRKFIGIFALLAYLVIYCLLAMGVASNYIIPLGGWAQAAYFVVAGFVWLPPAMFLISWMQRPDST